MCNIVSKPLRVHIEGNIGSGKSTLLDFLKQKSIIEVHPEPLKKWQDVNGTNVFHNYYRDPKKHSFAFQSYAVLTLTERALNPSRKSVQVYERSLESVRHCFLKALLITKAIDHSMKSILNEYIDFMKTQFKTEADLIVYIRTTPSNVLNRITNRGRSEERPIKKNYLTLLHSLHEKWIDTIQPGKVFIIDGDSKFEDLELEYNNCFIAIEQALLNHEYKSMQEDLSNLSINCENSQSVGESYSLF